MRMFANVILILLALNATLQSALELQVIQPLHALEMANVPTLTHVNVLKANGLESTALFRCAKVSMEPIHQLVVAMVNVYLQTHVFAIERLMV